MAVTLCVAPPASGKTYLAVERVCSLLAVSPLAQVWVIVPGRLQARAFRDHLALRGGALGAQVVTFRDVYVEILERVCQPVPVASQATLQGLMASILVEMAQAGSLSHYAPLAGSASFARSLIERFGELKSARVLPVDFIGMIQDDRPHLAELAHIYQAYQKRLQTAGWTDPQGVGWLAVQALEENPALLADWWLVVADGFDDFDSAQCKMLQIFSQRAAEVLVTLPGNLEMSRPVHPRFRRALQSLTSQLNPTLLTLESSPRLPAPLAALENRLLESVDQAQPSTPHVHLLEAQTASDEAREALRWIKAHVQRNNLAFSDCAVFVPEMGTYREPLRIAAEEFGLPIRFTHGRLLAETPAVAGLLDLLHLPILNYPRRLILDCLRSPYIDLTSAGLTPGDAAVLETVSFYALVVGGKEQWTAALEILAGLEETAQTVLDDEDGPQEPKVPKGVAARRLAGGLELFTNRLENSESLTIRGWVTWLESLLDELRFAERCEKPVIGPVLDILRSLAREEMVAGERVCGYTAFVAELQSILQASCFDPETSSQHPAILASRITEARGVRFQAVAILGLSEGVFPEVERPDALLDEPLRSRFGLDPRLGRGQASLFYQAVTRSDRFLLLTRPYLAKGGESWEPSHYWCSVERLFPTCKTRIRPDAPRDLRQAASREEALFWATRQRVAPQSDPELISRAQQVELGSQVLAARLADGQRNPYEGSTLELEPGLGEIYGEGHIWSASRLETYAACPYRYFAEQVLKLESKEPPELGFDPIQLGSMLHTILEKAYRQSRGKEVDSQAILESLPEIAAEVFRQAPQKYGFRLGPLWEAEKEQLLSCLKKTIVEMDRTNQGWIPVAFELAFGIQTAAGRYGYPPLEILTDIGKVRLHGFIDRVDRNADGQCRVVDYKTGSSQLSPSGLLDGTKLQLPLYALAAQDACQMGEVVDGLYWSIKGAEARLRLDQFKHEGLAGMPAALSLAITHVARIVGGIRAGDFPPQPPKSGCAGYCAPAAWCWRLEPGFGL